jgi:hypothetical protein
MSGRKRTLSKFEERDALLAELEAALARAVEQANETLGRTKAEIERSQQLMDGVPHALARTLSDRSDNPDQ